MAVEIKRWQVNNVIKALQTRRVVVISGARQTGKTTLTTQIAAPDTLFRTLDNDTFLQLAKEDSQQFVKNSTGTLVIDEIQKAPEIMSAIKIEVDKNSRPGQYLLTGSANIQTLPMISDSLAGRISHIRLRPLTQGEILNKTPRFLARAFDKDFLSQIKGYDKETIFKLAFRGGYPEAVKISHDNERKFWYLDYVESLLQKDLMSLEHIRRQDALRDLVKILAAWSSNYMNMAGLARQLNLSKPSFDTYLNALELMFIYERVLPWTKTDYEYVSKKPKFFATDTGLMTSILGWNQSEVLLDADRSGKLMETFVFQELAAQIDLNKYDYSLYQYRDNKKHEIDFLVERQDGALLGIEVKASSRVTKEAFAPQIWFRDNILKGKKPFVGYVLYSGEDVIHFADDLIALPVAVLWN